MFWNPDLVAVHQSGKIAGVITVESGHSIGTSLSVLRMYHQLGVRSLALTHNCNNPWWVEAQMISTSKAFLNARKKVSLFRYLFTNTSKKVKEGHLSWCWYLDRGMQIRGSDLEEMERREIGLCSLGCRGCSLDLTIYYCRKYSEKENIPFRLTFSFSPELFRHTPQIFSYKCQPAIKYHKRSNTVSGRKLLNCIIYVRETFWHL